jgi:hypothetical protein
MRRSILVFVCCLAVVFTGLILSDHAEAASRGQGVTKDMLPQELLNITIRDAFIPQSGKEAGVIQTVVGHAVVVHEDMRQAYFAAPGDKLFEKDILFTLKKSRCRFRMHNEDVVTLGETTRLEITAFADDRTTQEKRSSFGMAKGKAMFYTLRLFKHKGASMDVKTPTAVAGVRGTKFGVDVNEGKTDVFAFEGSIYVTSTVTGETITLPEGQSITVDAAGLGAPVATPPDVSQQFQRDTGIAPEDIIGLGTEGSAQGGDEPPLNTGGMDTSTLTQEQNISPQEEIVTPTRPTRHDGYFVGMLSRDSAGWQYDDTYISDTLQDFDSSNAMAATDDANFVIVDGTGGSAKQVAELSTGMGTWTGAQPMQRTELGYNAYMEWGSWTQPNLMNDGFYDYRFDNKGYYVWGDMTTNDQMAALAAANLVATYSGGAYGTFYTNTGGVDMTGAFSTTVNFHTGQLNNFQFNVAGGANTVTLTGGTGFFTGGSSQFDINGGTWSVNGGTGDTGTAYGSVYGDQAQAIGGVWQANGGGNHAAGMFQGTR